MTQTLNRFLILVFLVCLTCCGGASTSTDDSGDTSTFFDNTAWRTITNSGDVLAGLEASAAEGVLLIQNDSGETLEAPSLSVYDSTTGAESVVSPDGATTVATGQTTSFNFSFPEASAPEETALITLSFGTNQAAVFVTTASYDELSPAIVTPGDRPTIITPLSGIWDFEMNLSSSYLTGDACPEGSEDLTSSGETYLYVSNTGYAATWHVDDDVVTLNRSAFDSTFNSPTYSFVVEDDPDVTYGSNSWVLTPTSTTSIAGTLEWDNNQGCTASYPVALEYTSSASPTILTLCEGQWTIDYSLLHCGANTLTPASLANLPYPSGELDVTYDPTGAPISLSFDTLSSYQNLINVGGNNTYGSGFPSLVLGTTTDYLSAPLTLVGGFQMTALSETQIMGTVNLLGFGANACSGSGVFVMTALEGC